MPMLRMQTGKTIPKPTTIKKMTVDRNSKLSIPLAAGGGAAISIKAIP